MKKYLIFIVVLIFGIYMFGCWKKQTPVEESQEPMTMEALSTMEATVQPAPEAKVAAPAVPAKLEPLPPAGPYKPTAKEIQTALKNAGLYTGKIDGKIGPMTKKAIEEFQKANGFNIDGKVGPKTWEALSKYLNPPAAAPTKKR